MDAATMNKLHFTPLETDGMVQKPHYRYDWTARQPYFARWVLRPVPMSRTKYDLAFLERMAKDAARRALPEVSSR